MKVINNYWHGSIKNRSHPWEPLAQKVVHSGREIPFWEPFFLRV